MFNTTIHRPLRRFALFGVVGALLAVPCAAKETKVGQVGPFAIIKFTDDWDGKFNRCIASLDPLPTMLRFSLNNKRMYSVSVPAVATVPNPLVLIFDFNFANQGAYSYDAKTDGKRLWAFFDEANLADIIKKGPAKLVIKVGQKTFQWSYPKGTLEKAIVAMDGCVESAGF
ncbi:hypothetical protein [uncultured Thiodictyon sp.]|uniref:hypothetical protein n=1 Tax=uncultured Thiodictyon sp. TaxID=1846217 RepID=UPI0025F0A5AA|nr:hypothetical protein [uncultured Thiodictyon sp.]